MPWIIAALVAFAVVLVVARIALAFFSRWSASQAPKPGPEQPAEPRRAEAVEPGRPLAPPERKAPPPKPPEKPSPLQLRIDDRPDLKLASFQGNGQVQGDFGEMLTAVMLAIEGWKQLPSKMQGGNGIDGLFVRELRGGGGFEALCVETKTNNAAYEAATMSDAKLLGDVGALYAGGKIGKQTAEELTRALKQGPSFFRKELWRHDLSSGLTTISDLGRDGAKGRAITRSCARLMSTLFTSLEQFDRSALYVGRKPVDESEE